MDTKKYIAYSTGLLESLDRSIEGLEELSLQLEKDEQQQLLLFHLNNIKQIASILEDISNPIDISDKVQLSGNLNFRSIISQLGIEGEVIRLRESGKTIQDIATKFKLSTTAVNRFLKHYDTLSRLKQSKLKASSVMNTTERLEDTMNIILRQLHRLEGVNDDVHVKYVGELRQTIESAARISEKIVSYKTYQQFMETVKGILISESPDRASEIIRKIKAVQNDPLQAALNPNVNRLPSAR